MPGLLKSTPVSDEQRRANDRHRLIVVLAVLGILAVYVYLFTQAADTLGLRLPAELAYDLGLEIPHVFDNDGSVDSSVEISLTKRLRRSDDERLVLFATVAVAFLCAYFLPLRYKQASLALWATLAIGVLYGLVATAGSTPSLEKIIGMRAPNSVPRQMVPNSASEAIHATSTLPSNIQATNHSRIPVPVAMIRPTNNSLRMTSRTFWPSMRPSANPRTVTYRTTPAP